MSEVWLNATDKEFKRLGKLNNDRARLIAPARQAIEVPTCSKKILEVALCKNCHTHAEKLRLFTF